MKSKNEYKSWDEWEVELSRYAGELVGDEESMMVMSLPSRVLMMPDEEAREYVRDMMAHDHIDAIERIFDASGEQVRKVTIQSSEDQYTIEFIQPESGHVQ